MPASAFATYAYCLSYLRRKYTGDLAALKTFADEVFACATKEVALTSTAFEGGSSSGTIKFDKVILGQAVEALIAEQSGVAGQSRSVFSDFSRNPILT